MLDLLWLVPALPLAGFLTLLFAGRRFGEPLAGWLATLATAGSFAVTVGLFADLLAREGGDRTFVQTLFTWVPAGSLQVDAALLADPLSITMALFVTGVGALIHLYSIGYMHADPRFHQFFCYLNLFVFAMLVLVLGDNLLVTFLGWEGVGVCSYLLISFWFERDTAATAGKKAFITNRVGDWGFMLAMFLTFVTLGTLQYSGAEGILERAGELSEVTATAIALLLFVGAVGKSAQLPLYVWLPDAMEGPTPVSALIHAATMVTAGVYLMARINPLLASGPDALTVVAWVGALTALYAATIAVAQDDIKRVLAYSTISQLGYMFLAVGAGAYVAAIFHMVTHAFFKALLFLGAGSVIHGLHDEQDMRRMGALRRFMPVTAATFIVAWLAIAGVPPFSGFWSKDEILLNAWELNPVLWVIGLVTAGLTAYYMSRQVFMVFYGESRWEEAGGTPAGEAAEPEVGPSEAEPTARAGHGGAGEDRRPHESGWLMLVPLLVLAVLALVGGGLNLPFHRDMLLLEHWLEPVFEGTLHHVGVPTGTKWLLALITVPVALGGIGAAWLGYLRHTVTPPEPRLFRRGWYVDEALARLFGGPGRRGAELLRDVVDGRVVDGAVNGVATVVRVGGSGLRRVQTGFVRSYALGLAGGAVLLLVWFAVRGVTP